VRQESPAGVGEYGQTPRSAYLAVQLDAELGLEREQPVTEPLLGDGEWIGCGPNLPVARRLLQVLTTIFCGNPPRTIGTAESDRQLSKPTRLT
jgi:hypothetical protein